MGDRYLIVVRSEFLRGAEVAQASAMALAGSAWPSDPLSMRRVALAQLAQEIMAPTTTDALAAVTALNEARATSPAVPVAGPPANVTILEGIGAMIVDEDDLPFASLKENTVIDAIPNLDVELVTPMAGTQAAGRWHLPAMGLPQIEKGKDVLIGVLDTGIDATHGEFAGKTVHFREFNSIGSPLLSGARDASDHGTHVSGILAGATCGIAPSAELAVAAVLTRNRGGGRMSGTLLQIAGGLNWLLSTTFKPPQVGVDIINASLGVGVPQNGAARTGYNNFLATALRNARLAPGVLMVASIGNDGRRGEGFHGSPGNYGVVFSVGAVDSGSKVAPFSDWDTVWQEPGTSGSVVKPHVSAPGVNVLSAQPGGGFHTMSGTSMASPMVAGAAALLLQRNPALRGNPSALEAALMSCATAAVTSHPAGNSGGTGRLKL